MRSAPFRNVRSGLEHKVAHADIGRIATAVEQWYARGDTDAGNRMIFYFCGHGTAQGEDMALLARDFSLDAPNPLNGALDFRQLVNGLRRCRADEQLFFVDACRSGSDLLISQFGGGTFAGVVPRLGGGPPRPDAMTYYSTLAGEEAYARSGEVSLFTAALLKALRGAAGDRFADNDPWRVSTMRLQQAISHFLRQPTFAGAVSRVQRPRSTGRLSSWSTSSWDHRSSPSTSDACRSTPTAPRSSPAARPAVGHSAAGPRTSTRRTRTGRGW